MTTERQKEPQLKDKTLRWMMRMVGVSLAGASMFFITRDLPASRPADLILGLGTVLGTVTLASSWLPARKRKQKAEDPSDDDATLFI